MLLADAMVRALEPRFQVREDAVDHGQPRIGLLGIALHDDLLVSVL